jgi:tetratricopeptide (TPR) repeat protein
MKRYGEARNCHEAAVRLGDVTGNSHDGVAETYLRQGIEPQKALDRIEQAIAMLASPRSGVRINGGVLANRAWALALMGRRPEAERAIDQALNVEDSAVAPGWAGTNWRIGMALLAMEETGRAIEHFRTAAGADPHGNYGALSRERIQGR